MFLVHFADNSLRSSSSHKQRSAALRHSAHFIYLFILFSFLLVFLFLCFCLVVAVQLSLDRVTLVIIGVELPFLVPTWPFFSSFFFVFFLLLFFYRRWKKQKPSSVSVDGGCSFNELVGGFRSNQKGRAVGRLTDCVPSQSKGTITNGRPLN